VVSSTSSTEDPGKLSPRIQVVWKNRILIFQNNCYGGPEQSSARIQAKWIDIRHVPAFNLQPKYPYFKSYAKLKSGNVPFSHKGRLRLHFQHQE